MNFKGSEFIHMQREGLEWYELFLEPLPNEASRQFRRTLKSTRHSVRSEAEIRNPLALDKSFQLRRFVEEDSRFRGNDG